MSDCSYLLLTVLFLHELLFYFLENIFMLSWSLWERGQASKRVFTKYAGIDWHEKTWACCEHKRRSLHNAQAENRRLLCAYFIFQRKEFVLFGCIFLLMKQNTENKSWQLNIFIFRAVKADGKRAFLALSINWCKEWTKTLLNWISCLSKIVIAIMQLTEQKRKFWTAQFVLLSSTTPV